MFACVLVLSSVIGTLLGFVAWVWFGATILQAVLIYFGIAAAVTIRGMLVMNRKKPAVNAMNRPLAKQH